MQTKSLEELIILWEQSDSFDYEIRQMVAAWRSGNLDQDGIYLLREELEDALA